MSYLFLECCLFCIERWMQLCKTSLEVSTILFLLSCLYSKMCLIYLGFFRVFTKYYIQWCNLLGLLISFHFPPAVYLCNVTTVCMAHLAYPINLMPSPFRLLIPHNTFHSKSSTSKCWQKKTCEKNSIKSHLEKVFQNICNSSQS